MQKILDQSILEIKKEILGEIFLLLPEEERNKEGNEKGFQVEFTNGKDKFKIAFIKENAEKVNAEFYIEKGVKLKEIEKLDILILYKTGLMEELRRSGKKEIVSKSILNDLRNRVTERTELNMYKIDAETGIKKIGKIMVCTNEHPGITFGNNYEILKEEGDYVWIISDYGTEEKYMANNFSNI